MDKVIFFTAGNVPTEEEQQKIDALNAANKQIVVRSASSSCSYGDQPEQCDYVAGTPPESYSGTPTWGGNE